MPSYGNIVPPGIYFGSGNVNGNFTIDTSLQNVFAQIALDTDPGSGVSCNMLDIFTNWFDDDYWSGVDSRQRFSSRSPVILSQNSTDCCCQPQGCAAELADGKNCKTLQ